MKQAQLRKDPTFLSTIGFTDKKNTHKRYILSMAKYTEFTGMTPEQLLTEATNESTKALSQRMAWRHVRAFATHLKDVKCLAPNTVRGHVNDVMGFYTHNMIEMPKNTIENKVIKSPEGIEENMHIPDKITELRPFLQACNPRNRAIVLCQASSGMGSAEVVSMRVRHFKEGYDEKTNTCAVKLERIKTGFKYNTFLNPEACDAVKHYLNLRNSPPKYHGNKYAKYLEKHRVHTDNDFIFIKEDLKDTVIDAKTGRVNEELRRMQPRDIDIMYRTVYAKAGFKKTKQRIDIRSHNVRKYFSNTLKNAKMPKEMVEQMMGHKPSRLDAAYHIPDLDDLRNSYLHYMQYLSITEDIEYKSIETEEFKKMTAKLEAERETLQQQISEMQRVNAAQRLEIERLMHSSDRMHNKFAHVVSQLSSAGVIEDIEPDEIPGKTEDLGNGWVHTEMLPNPKKHALKQDPLDIPIKKSRSKATQD
ncbi:MAG: Phage integrase family protein [Methanomethylovorans sp. PtaU1.Bin073]|nr:MAG: Phage integrase family protein [Methanomethylovorans sp. PtaU1.Bin073]